MKNPANDPWNKLLLQSAARPLKKRVHSHMAFVLRPLLEEMARRSSTFCERYSLITGFVGVFSWTCCTIELLRVLLHGSSPGGAVDDPDNRDASQSVSLPLSL